MTTDYKSSVFLPKTDFPMRAGLPKKEPELLKRWADMKLFERLRAESKGKSLLTSGYVYTLPFVSLINTGVVDPFSYTQTPEAMAAIDTSPWGSSKLHSPDMRNARRQSAANMTEAVGRSSSPEPSTAK